MPQLFVRTDVWSLKTDDPVITAYAAAVAAMQAKAADDPTSWSYQAAIHGTYATPAQALWNQCRHGTWYFLAWRRMYVYYFESIVRQQVIASGGPANWALPYWNYDGGNSDNTLPMAFRNATSRDGSANPLYVAQRATGINAGSGLPPEVTSATVALGRPLFTGASELGGGVTSPLGQFWNATGRLEATPHNAVHNAVGGPGGLMSDPDLAAQDPIFWLHHANIDRLWWIWAQQPGHSDPSDAAWRSQSFSFFDADGTQVSLTGADIEDIAGQLGYTYEQAGARGPGSGGGKDERADELASSVAATAAGTRRRQRRPRAGPRACRRQRAAHDPHRRPRERAGHGRRPGGALPGGGTARHAAAASRVHRP